MTTIRRCRGLVFLHLFQKLLDALDVLLRRVQREMHLRQAAQLQPLDQFAANVSHRVFERPDRIALLFVRAFYVDIHARMLHVRLHAHFAHDDAAFEPRILQLSRQHGVDLVRDLLAHTFMSMIRRGHFSSRGHSNRANRCLVPPAQTISNLCPIKNDPKISSALSNTFCNISRTCFSSFDNVTTPITDRCQTSWCSNSATATLNSLRSLSFKLRSTCLLSLSDCASGMCSSRVSKPTGMSGPYFIVTRDRDLPTPSGGELLAPGRRSALSRGFGGRKLGHLEAFQNVADLDVVEVRDADAALEPGTNFARVVFETLQRTQLRRVDYRFIAQHAHLRIALEDAVDHVATGDRSQAFDAERVANFRAAQIRLLHDRLEQ